MKDPNDSATLDWVTIAESSAPIAVPPELAVVLNQMIDLTMGDILMPEYNLKEHEA